MDVVSEGILLREVAPGWTPEEVQQLTEARLIVRGLPAQAGGVPAMHFSP
jgi:acyl CoA:acetate/3-ketoacid CoA transferase beta subunit